MRSVLAVDDSSGSSSSSTSGWSSTVWSLGPAQTDYLSTEEEREGVRVGFPGEAIKEGFK